MFKYREALVKRHEIRKQQKIFFAYLKIIM